MPLEFNLVIFYLQMGHIVPLSDCNHVSKCNNLIFRPLYWMVLRLVLHKDSISFILAIKVVGYWCTQMLMYL